MTPRHNEFKAFLDDHVNLNPDRTKKLNARVEAINSFVNEHADLQICLDGGSDSTRVLREPDDHQTATTQRFRRGCAVADEGSGRMGTQALHHQAPQGVR